MPHYRAPAKVNLRLAVLAREDAGYHQIETLFCALDLADTLDIAPAAAGIALEVEGADVGPPDRNLCHRAVRAFCEAAAIPPAVRIRLTKNIPAGAGLGGGSSDAATTLRALNALYAQPLSDADLLELGAALGSDVPFFLARALLALAWGRGDRLLPLPPLPSRPVLIVAPHAQISTADAYASLSRSLAGRRRRFAAAVHDPVAIRDWHGIAEAAVNDFEEIAFEMMPALVRIRDTLRAAGASPALLSGSGSALFGVFPTEEARASARGALGFIAAAARVIDTFTASPGAVAPPETRR